MEIGQVIREKRRLLGLTQEELANRLGVTAPAVNKWERGSSLPDITLLGPIARLLGVSLEELLCFQEELSEQELSAILEQADGLFSHGDYQQAYSWVRRILAQWPNSEQLALHLAEQLDAWAQIRELTEDGERDRYITNCYIRALSSRDENLRRRAAEALFRLHMRWGRYDGAEAFLEHFSRYDPLGKLLRGQLLAETGRLEEAQKTHEELLFQGCSLLKMVFQELYLLAVREQDTARADMLAEKQCQLAALFEMGRYQTLAPALEPAVREKDADRAVALIEALLQCADTIDGFARSPLYKHMTFKPAGTELYDSARRSLLALGDGEAFLQNDPRW